MPKKKSITVVFRNGIIRDFESITEFCKAFNVNVSHVSIYISKHKVPYKLSKYYGIEEINTI